MKTISTWLRTLLVLGFLGHPTWGAEAVLETFQRGLFEEEANRNPTAAVEAYQKVLDQLEEQRKLAATVLFRMGECYRKLGRTNEAVAAYQKLLRDFPSQETLTTLAQQNLAGLGVAAAPTVSTNFIEPGNLAENMERNQIARLQDMIRNSPDLVNGGANRVAPLSEAAAEGKLKVAEFLLDHGANVNFVDTAASAGSPLHSAVFNGHKAMVELLLSRGANVNVMVQMNNAPRTALYSAAQLGYASVAEVLLKHGADINQKSHDTTGPGKNVAPLHVAVIQGHEPMVRFLIEHGADVNAQTEPLGPDNTECGTPLHWAVIRNKPNLQKLLLTSGSNPDAVNLRGLTPLHLAASRGDEEAVRTLVKGGADINVKSTKADQEGWTALHYAVQAKSAPTVKALLQLATAVDPIAPSITVPSGPCSRYTPLLMAALNSLTEIGNLLLEAKANVDFTNSCGENALLISISQNSSEFLQLLLDHGASARVDKPGGYPALILAQNNPKQVELLLEHGADPNAAYPDGRTLLHGLVLRLRQFGGGLGVLPTPAPLAIPGPIPSRQIRNPSGFQQRLQTIQAAASPTTIPTSVPPGPEREILNMAELLIAKGADVNRRDKAGYTPLNYFGIPAQPNSEAQTALANLLLSHGAIDAAMEPIPDPDTIRVWRSTWVETTVVLRKAKQEWNRYTLLETLTWNTPPFPDLSHVVIHRTAGTTKTNINVDLIDPANGRVDCTKTVWLEFGDVVEVPEKEHALSLDWNHVKSDVMQQIQGCLSRKLTVVFKEKELPRQYGYALYLRSLFQDNDVSSFLTSTADLSRVKVRRTDPLTGKQVEYLVNAVTAREQDDLWLRDDDTILVPEKGQ